MYRKPNQKLLEAGWKEKKLGGSGRYPIIIKVNLSWSGLNRDKNIPRNSKSRFGGSPPPLPLNLIQSIPTQHDLVSTLRDPN